MYGRVGVGVFVCSKPIRRGGEDVVGQMPPIWKNGFIFVQFFSLKLILYSFILN